MKILIEVRPHLELYSLQMYDKVYAYWQYLKLMNRTKIDQLEIVFSENSIIAETADVKVLHAYLPHYYVDTPHHYDLMIFDNADEPVSVIVTNEMVDMLEKYQHAYCICNSYTSKDYFLNNKIITIFGDWAKSLNYWVSDFYYHSFFGPASKFRNSVVYINGANRPSRQYFLDLIKGEIKLFESSVVTSNIVIERNFEKQICSTEDKNFIIFLYEKFKDSLTDLDNTENIYYYTIRDEFPVGIDGKFGTVVPGFEIIDAYFDHYCVAYPETSFKNDELALTEKSLKCFVSGALPFPIAGANINSLYNEIGFQTAHDLLPTELKFDTIKNHKERYEKASVALKWLNTNVEVLTSNKAQDIVVQNKNVYYQSDAKKSSIKQLYNILTNEKI